MKTRIGIITPPRAQINFQAVEEQMRQRSEIVYLPYSTTMELSGLYLEQASRFDGFLFSGNFPRDYIMEHVCPMTKPHRCLQLADRDIYRIIAKLYAQNPGIDFTRVVFDSAPSNRETLVRLFEDVFPVDRMPQVMLFSQRKNMGQVHQQMLESYRDRWERGTVDLVVTRMSNLGPMLERAGIPHVLLQPDTATVMECFSNLLSDIQSVRMERALTACCMIRPAIDAPAAEELALLENALKRFNAEQNRSLVLRRSGIQYEAVTSGTAAQELTCGCTTCLITSCLLEALPFSVHIGWGIGYDVVAAHQNALRAIRESERDPQKYTYLVNEGYEMVGPLCGERTLSYQIRSDPRVSQLARQLGIAPINLEKLISLQKRKQMAEFSTSDLVFYLDITPRSAARILRKLEQSGGAEQVRSVHINGRGRPAGVYRLDLDNIVL